MTKLDLNIEYNARKTVLNHAEISARWDEMAARYRDEAASAELDIPYGETKRSQYDFFPAPGFEPNAPLCVYIHGGYWRSRDRKTYSHIAKDLNERGISVAIPSYDLVPHVSILDIIKQMRVFMACLWEKTGARPVVAGNSAGGHLTGAMLATDWGRIDGVPDDLVTHAFALSGLYDLQPLPEIDVNEDLRLTPKSAISASPIRWSAPRDGLKFIAAVGSLESVVFKDQSRRVCDVWAANGIDTEYLEVSDCNHFTIVDAISTPGHMLHERLVAMIEAHVGA